MDMALELMLDEVVEMCYLIFFVQYLLVEIDDVDLRIGGVGFRGWG